MDNIEGKLDYLENTKSIIKASIENKGISIPDVTPFREYANAIDSISGGIETVEPIGDIGDPSSYLPVGNKDKDMVFIESLGVYQYNSESEEEADGEFTINAENDIGRWNLMIPSLEMTDMLIKTNISEIPEAEKPIKQYTILKASVSLFFNAVAANTAVEKTMLCPGAKIGDIVQITNVPSSSFIKFGVHAYVSANDTVSVRVINTTTASITPNASMWNISVFSEVI